MTKKEFLSKMPDIIVHSTWGYGELEIVVDNDEQKGVCYRHLKGTSSCGTYGATWLEVYDDLYNYLVSERFIQG